MSVVTKTTKIITLISFALCFIICVHKRDNIYDPQSSKYIPFTIPSLLSLTAVTTNSVSLSWSDPNNREISYLIYRGNDSLHYSLVASLKADSVEWTDTSCRPFTEYYYKLGVTNILGDTLLMEKAVRVRTHYRTPLDIPIIPTFSAPIGLKIYRTDESAVALEWAADSAGRELILLRGFREDSLNLHKIIHASTNFFIDTMNERRNHYYAVAFFDSLNRSPQSRIWISPLVPPSNLSLITMDSVGVLGIWIGTSNTTDSIRVERWTSNDSVWSKIASLKNGSTTFNDKAITPYTKYLYRIIAFSNEICSSPSNEASLWFGSSIPYQKDSTTLFFCKFDSQFSDSIPEETGSTIVRLHGSTRQSGRFGQAVETANNKIAIAEGTINYPDSSIVVDMWIKPHISMLPSERYGLLQALPGPFRIFCYQGKVVAEFKDRNNGYRSIFVDHVFLQNVWSHLVFVRNNGKSAIFINDSLKALFQEAPCNIETRQDSLIIGAARFPETGFLQYKCFSGLIDEVVTMSKPFNFFANRMAP